jgi:hypothetical protein
MDEAPKIKKLPTGAERRLEPRAKLTRPVRVRTDSADFPVEMRNTRDVSRNGFYFVTRYSHYFIGMRIYVVMGYQTGDPVVREWLAEVVRIEKLPEGNFGIGVRVLMR